MTEGIDSESRKGRGRKVLRREDSSDQMLARREGGSRVLGCWLAGDG